MAVLTNNIGGTERCVQSVEAWRINSALVKAANDMVIANRAIQIPLSEPFFSAAPRGSAIRACIVDDIRSFYGQFNSENRI